VAAAQAAIVREQGRNVVWLIGNALHYVLFAAKVLLANAQPIVRKKFFSKFLMPANKNALLRYKVLGVYSPSAVAFWSLRGLQWKSRNESASPRWQPCQRKQARTIQGGHQRHLRLNFHNAPNYTRQVEGLLLLEVTKEATQFQIRSTLDDLHVLHRGAVCSKETAWAFGLSDELNGESFFAHQSKPPASAVPPWRLYFERGTHL
jgi:hypothetical protein